MNTPEISERLPVLKALDHIPESAWILALFSLLATIESIEQAGRGGFAIPQLRQRILDEMERLDADPSRGSVERP